MSGNHHIEKKQCGKTAGPIPFGIRSTFFGGVLEIYVSLKEGTWRFPRGGVAGGIEYDWILSRSMQAFVAHPDTGLPDMWNAMSFPSNTTDEYE